jgi:hypothetical protein
VGASTSSAATVSQMTFASRRRPKMLITSVSLLV